MVAKQSNLEIDNFATLRREWKCSILKIVNFTELKTEKVIKMVKIEELVLKTKAIGNLLLAPTERAPQSYPRKSVNSKTQKIELNSFTKPGPSWPTASLIHSTRDYHGLSFFPPTVRDWNASTVPIRHYFSPHPPYSDFMCSNCVELLSLLIQCSYHWLSDSTFGSNLVCHAIYPTQCYN